MKSFQSILLVIAFLFYFVLGSSSVMAQEPNPGCDPFESLAECCARTGNTAYPCPIDGGLVALLAAGVGYGIKKTRDARKKTA